MWPSGGGVGAASVPAAARGGAGAPTSGGSRWPHRTHRGSALSPLGSPGGSARERPAGTPPSRGGSSWTPPPARGPSRVTSQMARASSLGNILDGAIRLLDTVQGGPLSYAYWYWRDSAAGVSRDDAVQQLQSRLSGRPAILSSMWGAPPPGHAPGRGRRRAHRGATAPASRGSAARAPVVLFAPPRGPNSAGC